jgi:hypothetical protein
MNFMERPPQVLELELELLDEFDEELLDEFDD